MPGLAFGWEYLTGYAVATDPTSRDRAEWPPHPGRIFMALAAAYFETGEDPAEGAALRWLETLGNPELLVPPRDRVFERSAVTVYVPVNDKAGPSAASLQSAPAFTRSKQPRTFPCVWVGDGPCMIHWSDAKDVEKHSVALEHLCGKVTRIGHSSSLVQMWVADESDYETSVNERLIADERLAEVQVRSITVGTLTMLAERFNESARKRHAELSEHITDLKTQKKTENGSGSKERKDAIDTKIGTLQSQLDVINPRPPLRPSLGLWTGYRRNNAVISSEYREQSHFDTDLLVLTHIDGPRLPLVSALAVTRALRDTVMSHSGVQPVPAWISGHEANGQPLRSEEGHLGCIPLPFVGREHADGHLLGVGLVFPRAIDRPERGRVLGKLLLEQEGQSRHVELKLGRLGVWTIKKRDWTETRESLKPETWTANAEGADTWASVTPVVLNRFPKADRTKNRAEWTDEVVGIVVESCTRIGLPKPVAVDIDTTSWHRGSPRATSKWRPLRGHQDAATNSGAALGDGFPLFPPKGTKAPRLQVHVWVRFAGPVLGPVLIGAGRYLGYGLCKPWKEPQR